MNTAAAAEQMCTCALSAPPHYQIYRWTNAVLCTRTVGAVLLRLMFHTLHFEPDSLCLQPRLSAFYSGDINVPTPPLRPRVFIIWISASRRADKMRAHLHEGPRRPSESTEPPRRPAALVTDGLSSPSPLLSLLVLHTDTHTHTLRKDDKAGERFYSPSQPIIFSRQPQPTTADSLHDGNCFRTFASDERDRLKVVFFVFFVETL